MNFKSSITFVGVMMVLGGCSGVHSNTTNTMNGKFTACPDKPNCVSSMEPIQDGHYIEPYQYSVERQRAISSLKEVVLSLEGGVVKEEHQDYLYVEFHSKFFGFIDDVEFYFPENKQQVEIKSASRKGYWDMGVNRKRLELIRDTFLKELTE